MVTTCEIQQKTGNRKKVENISAVSETNETALRKPKYSSLEKE